MTSHNHHYTFLKRLVPDIDFVQCPCIKSVVVNFIDLVGTFVRRQETGSRRLIFTNFLMFINSSSTKHKRTNVINC